MNQLTNRRDRSHHAVRPVALHLQVETSLRGLIHSGQIAPGEKLNEALLASALAVSRTPLREAIKLLASEGLIDVTPGRGARVRRFLQREIFEHFELVGALERHAVESATPHLAREQRHQFEALQGSLRLAFEQSDTAAYLEANQSVHRLWVSASGNQTLIAMHQALTFKIRPERETTLSDKGRWRGSLDEHEAITHCMMSGDGEQAGRLVLEHARRTGLAIVRLGFPDAGAPLNEET